jgi:hypothetical protein
VAKDYLKGLTALCEANPSGAIRMPTVKLPESAKPEMSEDQAVRHIMRSLFPAHNADRVKSLMNTINRDRDAQALTVADGVVFCCMYLANVLQSVPREARTAWSKAAFEIVDAAVNERPLEVPPARVGNA